MWPLLEPDQQGTKVGWNTRENQRNSCRSIKCRTNILFQLYQSSNSSRWDQYRICFPNCIFHNSYFRTLFRIVLRLQRTSTLNYDSNLSMLHLYCRCWITFSHNWNSISKNKRKERRKEMCVISFRVLIIFRMFVRMFEIFSKFFSPA